MADDAVYVYIRHSLCCGDDLYKRKGSPAALPWLCRTCHAPHNIWWDQRGRIGAQRLDMGGKLTR